MTDPYRKPPYEQDTSEILDDMKVTGRCFGDSWHLEAGKWERDGMEVEPRSRGAGLRLVALDLRAKIKRLADDGWVRTSEDGR